MHSNLFSIKFAVEPITFVLNYTFGEEGGQLEGCLLLNILNMRIVEIINGPNLNMLGTREVSLYGGKDFNQFLEELRKEFPEFKITCYQSNIEGEIVSRIQERGFKCDALIINPAAYTHTSVAIADAIAMLQVPVTEVHITNLLTREEYRHNSLTGRYCRGSIMGFGLDGYRLAMNAIRLYFSEQKSNN